MLPDWLVLCSSKRGMEGEFENVHTITVHPIPRIQVQGKDYSSNVTTNGEPGDIRVLADQLKSGFGYIWQHMHVLDYN